MKKNKDKMIKLFLLMFMIGVLTTPIRCSASEVSVTSNSAATVTKSSVEDKQPKESKWVIVKSIGVIVVIFGGTLFLYPDIYDGIKINKMENIFKKEKKNVKNTVDTDEENDEADEHQPSE
ncbi:MAG: hypothetical protein K6D02_01895 [Lachnospiraceae bacterium]|nr:hypothetical protein [Lachnospiraceae bacterium]